MDFMFYKRSKSYTEMRKYVPGEKLEGVSITMSDFDKNKGHPKEGDMIARDPDNHADQWLVHKDYFQRHYIDIGYAKQQNGLDGSIEMMPIIDPSKHGG